MLAGARNPRLADRQHVVVKLRHFAGVTVEDFIFEEDHRVGIADRRLQQPLGIRRRIRRDHLQARNMGEPRRIVLAVLSRDTRRCAVGATEHDRGFHLSAGHVEGLRRGVDDLVHRLHGEIEGHELDDRLEAGKRRADTNAGKPMLGDRSVDHAPVAELLQQALSNLVGTLIFGNLFTHHEHIAVATHFLGHRVAQGFAHGHGDHLGAGRKIRIRRNRGGSRGCGGRSWRGSLGGGRRHLGGLLRRRRCRGISEIGRALPVAQDHGDRGVDSDVGGALRNQDLAEGALVGGLDFHCGLVGFNLGDHVAGLDGFAFLLQPFGKVALLHGRRECWHQNLNRHGCSRTLSGKRRCRARMHPAPDHAARSQRRH